MAEPQLTVTVEDVKALKAIEAAFAQNLLRSYPDAEKIFRKNVGLSELFTLMAGYTKFTVESNKPNTTPEKQAKALIGYCDFALTPLRRAFGEAVLVAALPPVAGEQRTIDVCRALGADGLANLCEKAKNARKA